MEQKDKTDTGLAATNSQDIAALAEAMNNLAAAINNMTEMAQDVRRENPDMAALPGAIAELAKRLAVLSARL